MNGKLYRFAMVKETQMIVQFKRRPTIEPFRNNPIFPGPVRTRARNGERKRERGGQYFHV